MDQLEATVSQVQSNPHPVLHLLPCRFPHTAEEILPLFCRRQHAHAVLDLVASTPLLETSLGRPFVAEELQA